MRTFFRRSLLVLLLSPMTIARPAFSQTVSNFYSFTGVTSSGSPGAVAPAQGRDGKLYGTTFGPTGTDGSIFKIAITGPESQIYTFGSDGANPDSSLILAEDGNFYGTTYFGGSANDGVLFRVSPTGTYSALHEFTGGADGANPAPAPIQASDGNIYGVTYGVSGASTIYEYEMNGTFSTIYSFDEAAGEYASGVTEGTDGNLYGSAELGGSSACGTLFKVTKSGTLLWSYSFSCGATGGLPVSPLLQASDGNFYGTAYSGGHGIGCGTVFRLNQAGSVSAVYAFKDVLDGCNSVAGLTQGTDGNLYSTTPYGGKGADGGGGTLYKLTPQGAHTILYDFGTTGNRPLAAPMQDTNGTFYGTTSAGGRDGFGTVYSLNMGLGPFVAFVQPTGAIGGAAQILGQGLTGTTSVTFNGVASTSIKIVNDTYITAAVPTGATTGKVVVTTPGGALTSNVNFRILP